MTSSPLRTALSVGLKYQRLHQVNLCNSLFPNVPKAAFPISARPCLAINLLPAARTFSTQEVTKNLRLMTTDDEKLKVDRQSLAVEVRKERPLVVFLEWMAARKNHVKKFTDLYLDSGYDVLLAPLTPAQLLFPTSGSQLVADDIIRFLAGNPAYKKVIVHGFSVGGYLWGEVNLKIDKHPALPQQVVGQVWDSLVDVVGVAPGVAASIFPKSDVMKRLVLYFIELHLLLFKNVATKHYETSSSCFRNPAVKSPALVLASKSDPICSFKEMMDVVDDWKSHNVQVTMKIWEESPHVGHFRKHRREYVMELNNFLQSLQLPGIHDNEAEKIVSKL